MLIYNNLEEVKTLNGKNNKPYTSGQRLKQVMNEKNLKQVDILRMSEPYQKQYNIKLSKSNVSEYVNDKSKPDQDKIYLLAKTLDVTEPWLMGYDVSPDRKNRFKHKDTNTSDDLVSIYNKLDKPRQTKVLNFAKSELDDQNGLIKENNELYTVDVIEKVAAGTGYSYGNNEIVQYLTDRTDLHPYDTATLVTGDSMEPTYKNGDVVLIKSGYNNINGDVYVIDYNSKSYIKKLYNDGDRFRLVSINKKYENIIIDIPVNDDVYFNIVGKVVDSFTPIK